jgi:hypothetical protein
LEAVIILGELPTVESRRALTAVLLDQAQHPEIRAGAAWAYQGSKRNLAPAILGYFPERVGTLIKPSAGSVALTLAAAPGS